MHLSAAVMSLDGSTMMRSEDTGPAEFPRELGRKVGLALIAQGAQAIVDETRV